MTYQKWFTCTPVRFNGDATFFARDSGLLCKGFQAIGVDCKAIMPGPPMDGDQTDDLIRTNYENLEDSTWWLELGADAVVLYAWGSGRYRKIAKAIRMAGIPLVSNMDSSGILGIISGASDFVGRTTRVAKHRNDSRMKTWLDQSLRILNGFLLSPLGVDVLRAAHLRNSSLIGCVTPLATDRIKRACKWYGGMRLANRVVLIPHPIAPYMRYDPAIPKKDRVIAIGRWDDTVQKDPMMLASVIDLVCSRDPSVEFQIAGRMPEKIKNRFQEVAEKHRDRVHIHGVLPNAELKKILMESRISLCTSTYESFHIASGEALCCGLSIIGPDLPEIPSMKWFAVEPHGRSAKRTPEGLANAVIDELHVWRNGGRNAQNIADQWAGRIHAPQVAATVIELLKNAL